MGQAKDPLIGLKVQIVIEEDGTRKPPILPVGTLTGRVGASGRNDYYLVHLDSPVKCVRATTGKDWVLLNLVIATRFAGESLTRLATATGRLAPEPFPDGIVVGIMNLFAPHPTDDPLIDFSEGEYFAIGLVRRS
jgi:hypothetical protein